MRLSDGSTLLAVKVILTVRKSSIRLETVVMGVIADVVWRWTDGWMDGCRVTGRTERERMGILTRDRSIFLA